MYSAYLLRTRSGWRNSVINRLLKLGALLLFAGAVVPISGQIDSIVGQVTQSGANSFAGGISGDGRLVVFESTGNLATENPRNSDLNREVFLFDYAQRRIFQITDTRSLPIEATRGAFGTVTLTGGASGTVNGITVDGVQIMSGPVSFATSLSQTATNVASNINAFNSSPNYTASATDNVVTVTAAIPGPASNGLQVVSSATTITTADTNLAGGFDGSGPIVSSNTKVQINNITPVISNDGRWIAFSSNATTSTPGNSNGTNPGDFDALDYTMGDGTNPLEQDANMEIWLYQIPAVAPVDLSQGDDIPVTPLTGGTFIQVTNSNASRIPVAGSGAQLPLIAADNTDPSVNDNGNVVAFVSNRDLVPTGNAAPQDNPEIFTYVRGSGNTSQVTSTPRGTVGNPQYNNAPTISGNGMRVMFVSNSQNPIVGMSKGNNTDLNEEVFFADLDPNGAPAGVRKQVTVTSPANPGDLVNIVNFGRRMSRDGRFIAFDSHADFTNEHAGANQAGFATFLYDASSDAFERVGPRSDADAGAAGGDIARYPGFTDYDMSGAPQTLVLETRLNIAPDGTIPADEEDGLNPDTQRPAQMYAFPIGGAPLGAGTFTRLTKLPSPTFFLGSLQPLPSNNLNRVAFSIPQSEVGTGNPDLSTEVYYLLIPTILSEGAEPTLAFFTGATQIPISNDPLPTPSPTATPTPSGSPTPTPTATPPETPATLQGISRGMLAEVNYGFDGMSPAVNKTGTASLDRRFNLPMELGGVTMSINGVSVGLKEVTSDKIIFIAPLGLGEDLENPYPVVINNNGVVIRGEITFSAYRPDIFLADGIDPGLNRAKVFNVTNRVHTTEPFTVLTLKYRGGVKVDTNLRMFLTGVEGAPASTISIVIGETAVPGDIQAPVLREPGVYSIDFDLAPVFDMAGDQPVTIIILSGTAVYQGRRQADAPRIRIL